MRQKIREVFGRLFVVAVLLSQAGLGYAGTQKNDSQAAPVSAMRPDMPDGLYMVDWDVPFLLVEDGQWLDPYEWVEKNGIDALNTKYVQGLRFERFHIHTQLGSNEGMKLYSLTAKDMLKSSKIINEIKFDLKKLAPRISAERCEDGGKDLWNCKTDGVIKSYVSGPPACNTGKRGFGCPDGISAGDAAVKEILGWRGSKTLPRLNSDPLSRKIGSAYSISSTPLPRSALVKVDGSVNQIFSGTGNVQMVSGVLHLYFKPTPVWKRKDKWQIEPFSTAQLGFIWDVEKERFVYLQEHVRILSKAAQSVCERALQPHYCPRAMPLGMWESGGKLYAAIRYEQHLALWHYPPDLPMNGMDRKGVRAAQIEVIEVGREQAAVIFSTRHFIATY